MEQADWEESYRAAAKIGDLDALHDLIARHGMSIFERGLPYIVISARNRSTDIQRRERRASQLLSSGDTERHLSNDPYDLVQGDRSAEALLTALAALPDSDVSLLWWTAEGLSDNQIAEQLYDRGFVVAPVTPAAVRKRRQRAREAIRASLKQDRSIS